ncbi:hypothetical protein K438DRAFT_1765238 [Mycena galopus ATCC 62051]|nr:hypothetical protein K438DRAFT_1765238 [Mycena galopus ATCC 62051]
MAWHCPLVPLAPCCVFLHRSLSAYIRLHRLFKSAVLNVTRLQLSICIAPDGCWGCQCGDRAPAPSVPHAWMVLSSCGRDATGPQRDQCVEVVLGLALMSVLINTENAMSCGCGGGVCPRPGAVSAQEARAIRPSLDFPSLFVSLREEQAGRLARPFRIEIRE